ncbi:hypothetical protein DMA11_22435 [Marinilabiliaceae bacterium JC017]|nr:hypothetical protein DMA11_22435 [Marinilabiliaceae bacterium JC017]
MTASELKKLLKHRIEEINDEAFLNTVKTILDSKLQSQTLILKEEQRNEIIESQKNIKEGLYHSQSEMDKEFNKWLNAK